MALIYRHRSLYYGVLLISAFLFMAATGGGLWGTEGFWISDWQHKAFRMLCHQDPSRSFQVSGVPMAVCSRCYGIYASFAIFWIAIPFLGSLIKRVSADARNVLVAVILLNGIDIFGNMIGFWQNTLFSRFLLGSAVGVTAVFLVADDFINIKELKQG